MKKLLTEKRLYIAFRIGLWFKVLVSVTEILSGIAVFFFTQHFLVSIVQWVVHDEYSEDPHDIVSNFFLHSAQNMSLDTKHFVAFYLVAHGLLILWLVIGLLRQRFWYYSVAIIVFGIFVLDQLHRYYYTHSVTLLFVTVIDIIIIILTWHEWRFFEDIHIRKQVEELRDIAHPKKQDTDQDAPSDN